MNELINTINDAFFRLESFLNGNLPNYEYFGFDSAFTKLFLEAKKENNFTYKNCKLIGQYYVLLNQLSVSIDKSDFSNQNAYENNNFIKVSEEIDNLQWERVEEFCEFSTDDEIEEYEHKFSITDILKKTNGEIDKLNKRKKIDSQIKLIDLFNSTESYNSVLSDLISHQFIRKNGENLEWTGSKLDTSVKPIKLLCILAVILGDKEYLKSSLKNNKITSAINNTFSNITISEQMYGQVKREFAELSAGSKINDYKSCFYFISPL